MFIGRKIELNKLKKIDQFKKASLVVCLGRRRIGKSRLIEEFAKEFSSSLQIQGLAPAEKQTNQDQLHHFSKEISRQLKLPKVLFSDWMDAFYYLAQQTSRKRILIFLDEISWLGQHDPDFPGKLKIAWDTHFKKNINLRMVLCGSVSSWIQKNILHSTHFLGRISLEINLKEFTLSEVGEFWLKQKNRISSLEKLRILNLTGGVARYLEEIDYKISAEENYKNLCFNKNGFLFEDFNKIFIDIFERRSSLYSKIVQTLDSGAKSLTEISKTLRISNNGALTSYLEDLELSGFISRETMWNLENKKLKNKTIRFRITDCYLRFYFKFIKPYELKISKNLMSQSSIEKLPSFDIFTGLQFETLIQNNYLLIISALGLSLNSVENVGPYLQTETNRSKKCQIDLLIQTKSTLYICELKARKYIDHHVIDEVKTKTTKLKYPKTLSVRPVLIYAGLIDPQIAEEDYFDKIISLDELLNL